MKKLLPLMLSVLLAITLFAGCAESDDNLFQGSTTTSTESATTNSASLTEKESKIDSESELSEEQQEIELIDLDIFESVSVSFNGWNSFGTVTKINTTWCEDLINDNVTFSLATDYTNLSNGDTIVVNASYDDAVFNDNGYQVLYDSKEFEVSGLYVIADARDYHDGVAWVQIYNNATSKKGQWLCCDKEGNIVFSLKNGSTPKTDFVNGVAIVDYDRIVDTSGNVVWSTAEDGYAYAEERWGSDSVVSIEIESVKGDFCGYAIVKFDIDTFAETGWFFGVLDYECNWQFEPDSIELDYTYEYCIYEYFGESEHYYYNITTNEFIYINSRAYYCLWILDYITERHQGLAYRTSKDLKYAIKYGVLYNSDTTGYYNSNCELVIDLESLGYNIQYASEFNDGYAFLEILNNQGSKYYTIIDINGTQMFSPQKLSADHSELKCGFYWMNHIGYMNVYGEVAFDIELESGEAFSEGMAAVVTPDSQIHYINTNGEIVF